MSNPKKVGEGSYGCVHNPPLKCKNKPYNPDPTKVSKILTRKNANNELKEFKLIQNVDKKEDFHLGQPDSCFPDDNAENQTAIDQCKRFDSMRISTDYKLLLLKNGGNNLSQIEDKFKKLTLNNTNRIRLENFWLDMSRLIYGSKVLMDNGIVHHDLKQQNIVYNEKNGRVNFIDFGLMMTTKEMIKKAEGSRYPFGEHWSFPPDILFYNYVDYNKLTSGTGKDKSYILRQAWKKYLISYSVLRDYLSDVNEEQTDSTIRMVTVFLKTYKNLTNSDEDYKKFIDKSFETFDNYSIGFSLFSILKATKKLIDDKLFNDLRLLFLSMMTFDAFERPSPSEVVDKYEFILKSNGLLDKYNMRFENHFLVEGTEKQEQEKIMEELPKSDKTFINDLVLKCPEGEERNPKTKRCINKCKEGYSRDADFKCKRNKTQKKKPTLRETITAPIVDLHKTPERISNKTKTQKKKVCEEGKELNPKTNRCVNKCKQGYARDADFKCKKLHKQTRKGGFQ
jgi:serine/threonine protein kinase